MDLPASMSVTKRDLECMLFDEAALPKALPFSLLEEITDGFSDDMEIGRGGFAVVYKARLDNSVIAVKRLSNTYMHEKEFHQELECLIKATHKNVIRFLGYCAETLGNMQIYNRKLVMADVQQRFLCFEYLPKGSLDKYITDPSTGLEWRDRYNIIKGICEGLYYLHQNKILHLDLKPGNILLDEDMMPKITDFGLSRLFDADQTRVITRNIGGTLGYLAPEFFEGEITYKFDFYSLGVIITEILTGMKGYHPVEQVLECWSNRILDISQWGQIQVCTQIALECTDFNPARRPGSMMHIISRLLETEFSTHVIPEDVTSELLLLHHFKLCFPFEPNKVVMCPLQLTNNTDKHVAFRLMDKSMKSSFLLLPMYGLVPPNTPYTLVVSTQVNEELPQKYIIDVILHSATLKLGDDEHINTLRSQPDKFFEGMGNAVQEVKLKAIYTLPGHITTSLSKPMWPTIKIICKVEFFHMYSLDINQAKQWIIVGDENGNVSIWDYQTQRKVDSIKVKTSYARSRLTAVSCVKFIARKEWIVAVTKSCIHVYNYEKMKKITSFRIGSDHEELVSLAVHPTKPYLLSAGRYIKLWDWDKGWECIQTYEYEDFGTIVTFNPNDIFASASTSLQIDHYIDSKYGRMGGVSTSLKGNYTVKVWGFDSPKSIYTLSGHSKQVNCLDFFKCHDHEFLATGSDDRTTKIWYLQDKICAYTLEAFVSPVTSVLYQPNLQTLITGSEDGAIYLWSTTDCSMYSCPPTLKGIIKIGCVGAVYHLARAMGRVVIGKENSIAIMNIDSEQSTDYSEQQLSADTRQHTGDTTPKMEMVSKTHHVSLEHTESEPRHASLEQTESKPYHLPLQHLKDITNNFCNERVLGRGGFGVVYKGVLQNGKVVAVKKFVQAEPSSQKQFENEANLLMKLEHPNIVRLVGYCCETQHLHTPHEGKYVFAENTESLLCLEFLPNGSLDEYISDEFSKPDWCTRWKIIEGICSGLQYLHEQSNGPIVHLDIKPANILLDENMLPKIADFGLSRLFDQKQTISTKHTIGTLGYISPEYFRGIITPMSDIFSLGVIILEVITGHRNYPYDIRRSSEDFIKHELQKWRNVLQEELTLKSLDKDCEQIKRCIQIGLICVNLDRTKRPTMKKIINMLQGLESMDYYISNELSCHDIQEEQ